MYNETCSYWEKECKAAWLKCDELIRAATIYKTTAERLWTAIDDISTYDDMAKGNNTLFRHLVSGKVNSISQNIPLCSLDGYVLTWESAAHYPYPDKAKTLDTPKVSYEELYVAASTWKAGKESVIDECKLLAATSLKHPR